MSIKNQILSASFNKLMVISLVLGGIIGGVSFNYALNQQPAPISIDAANPTPTKTPTPTPTKTPTPTPTPTPSYSITGHIFIDNNANGKENSEDSNYTNGATVSATLNTIPFFTLSKNTGTFTFSSLQNGVYSVFLVVPDSYRVTTDNPVQETISNGNVTGVKFGIVPNNWNIPTNEHFVMCKDLRQFVRDHCD